MNAAPGILYLSKTAILIDQGAGSEKPASAQASASHLIAALGNIDQSLSIIRPGNLRTDFIGCARIFTTFESDWDDDSFMRNNLAHRSPSWAGRPGLTSLMLFS